MLNIFLRSVVAALALMAASTALAQWQWVDESGKKVYSDRPPPLTVPESSILKAPKGAMRPNRGERSDRSRGAASGGTQSGADQASEQGHEDLELKARAQHIQAEQEQASADNSAEIAQHNVEVEKSNAAARKGNCERARSRLAQLQDGKRVMSTDASGSVGFMSDATRASERKMAQDLIQANCS